MEALIMTVINTWDINTNNEDAENMLHNFSQQSKQLIEKKIYTYNCEVVIIHQILSYFLKFIRF